MQPVSLDRTNMELLRIRPYLVSYKADGYRYLLLIADGKVNLVARDNSIFMVNTPLRLIQNDLIDEQTVPLTNTLLDVVSCNDADDGLPTLLQELVKEEHEHGVVWAILVFDIISFEGQVWYRMVRY